MKVSYLKQTLFVMLMTFMTSNVLAQSGNALDFDGVDDYISVPDNALLNPTNVFTIEAWIYARSSSDQTILCKSQYLFDISSSKLRFLIRTNTEGYPTVSSLTDVPVNTWVHVAAVADGFNLYIYENGTLKNTFRYGGYTFAAVPGNLTIGRLVSDGYFSGTIDEVRIWNVARSQTDIQNNMNSTITSSDAQWSDLGAYYQFDQGTAGGNNSGVTQLTDNSSSGSNTGTLNNFALTGTTSNWVAIPFNVSTNNFLPITESSIQMNGSILGTGGTTITTRGFCYSSTNTNPTIADSKIEETGDFSDGSYSLTATGLTSGATYYFCAFATNSLGTTAYGSVKSVIVNFPMGNALDFDGVDDYISIPDNTSLNPTNALTIEAWIYTKSSSVDILQKSEMYNLYSEDGYLTFMMHDNLGNVFYVSPSTSIPTDTWVHCAVVFDGSNLYFYVNGINLDESVSVGTTLINTSSSNLTIGVGDYLGYFPGEMDEVRIWNVARTQSEIQNNMGNYLAGSETGLVAYYRFDQGDAGNDNTGLSKLTDYSNYCNTGTLNNFDLTSSTSNWVASVIDGASIIGTTSTGTYASNSATITGNIFSIGASSVTTRGFQYATDACFTTDVNTQSETGSYTSGTYNLSLTGLSANTTYYVRSYSINDKGLSYGNVLSFFTNPLSNVGINVANGQITNTSVDLEYSLNSTNGTDGDWYSCSASNTSVIFDAAGNFKVYVREAANTSNSFLVSTVAAQAAAPSVSVSDASSNSATLIGADNTMEYQYDGETWTTVTGSETFLLNGVHTLIVRVKATALTVASLATADLDNLDNSNITTVSGNALSFDGSDDYVSFSSPVLNNLQTGTIEMWVKWTGTQDAGAVGYGHILGRQVNSVFSNQVLGLDAIDPSTAKVQWFPYSIASGLTGSTVVGDNQWNHIAITYNSGEHKLYINGKLDGTATIAGTIYDYSSIVETIGAWIGDGDGYFKGQIDEVRVWNVARTESEIKNNMGYLAGSETGLVAYYRFDQGNAGNDNTGLSKLTDCSNHCNTGTLNNFALTGSTSNWVFSGTDGVPIVKTTSTGTPGGNSATITGNIISMGASSVTTRGFQYATDACFTTDVNTKSETGTFSSGSYSLELTGLSELTTYYVRAFSTNSEGTNYGDPDVSFTTLTNCTWTGATNSDWATATNWTGAGGSVPTSTSDVVIPDVTNDPVIGATTVANCNNLTITGSLTIQSSASGTGSLIVGGTTSGNVTVERYMDKDAWHLVSSPVSGQTVGAFLTSNTTIAENPSVTGQHAMKGYNETTNAWNALLYDISTDNMGVGNGFAVWPDNNGTASFTGSLQSGNKDVAVVKNGYGWNCIGNPHTSAIAINNKAIETSNFIDLNSAMFADSYAAIYVWEQGNSKYTIINHTSDAYYIPVGQGFFVRTLASGNFSFTSDLQSHQPSAEFKSAVIPWPEIKLTASLGDLGNNAVIRFNDAMGQGLDVGYDAGVFKSGLDVYTRLVDDNGVDFGIQCLPLEANSEMAVPIGLESNTQGTVALSVDINNLPSGCKVTLEDRETGTFTPITQSGQVASLQMAANSKVMDRFYLHTSYSTTGVTNLPDDWRIYVTKGQICVSGQVTDNATAAIYDVLGRKIGGYQLQQGSLNYIPCSGFRNGVYLVTIRQQRGTFTKKVVVNMN